MAAHRSTAAWALPGHRWHAHWATSEDSRPTQNRGPEEDGRTMDRWAETCAGTRSTSSLGLGPGQIVAALRDQLAEPGHVERCATTNNRRSTRGEFEASVHELPPSPGHPGRRRGASTMQISPTAGAGGGGRLSRFIVIKVLLNIIATVLRALTAAPRSRPAGDRPGPLSSVFTVLLSSSARLPVVFERPAHPRPISTRARSLAMGLRVVSGTDGPGAVPCQADPVPRAGRPGRDPGCSSARRR